MPKFVFTSTPIKDLYIIKPTVFGDSRGYFMETFNQAEFELYVPEGFAHGFYVLSDSVVFTYKCTRFYQPDDEAGILWNDPDIGVKWPINNANDILLSDKDKNNLSLKELKFAYDF